MAVKVQRKKGTKDWYLVVHRNGGRTVKKVGRDKAKAEEAARELEKELLLRDLGIRKEKPASPTLLEYWKDFEGSYASCQKPTTQSIYTNNFNNHILPQLGSKPLDEIERLDVEKLIAHLMNTKKLAKATIRIVMSNLNTLMNHAVEHDVIEKNPARKTAKLYRNARERTTEIQPYTEREVRQLLEGVIEHCPQYYEVILCAVHTGMRCGELAGLQWNDVDLNGKHLMVRRQVVWGRVQTTKGNNTRRIDLSNALLDALKTLKRKRQEQWLQKGENEIPKWVFCNRDGNPVDMPNFKARHFYKCLEKAGLRKIRFHDLRHTFATLLLQNGEPIAYVKEQLGHSSIKLTVDTYCHWMPGKNREAMDRLPVLASIKATSNGEVISR